jgi:hypothetical protein
VIVEFAARTTAAPPAGQTLGGLENLADAYRLIDMEVRNLEADGDARNGDAGLAYLRAQRVDLLDRIRLLLLADRT